MMVEKCYSLSLVLKTVSKQQNLVGILLQKVNAAESWRDGSF